MGAKNLPERYSLLRGQHLGILHDKAEGLWDVASDAADDYDFCTFTRRVFERSNQLDVQVWRLRARIILGDGGFNRIGAR